MKVLNKTNICIGILGWILLPVSCTPEYGDPNPFNYEDFVKEQDKYPAFSPDGEHIAYYHYSSQWPEPADYPSGLYIIDKNGNNRQLVLEGHHYNPAWSPDGQWLVFSTQGVIQKCKINGDSLSRLNMDNENCFFPDYTPDGKKIIFDRMVTEEGSLLIVDANFIDPPQIFSIDITTGRDPEYSPDGNYLIYMKGSRKWPHWEIFVMDSTGSTDLRLTNNDADDLGPTWSPNGQQIAWSSNVRVHTMNADGSSQKFLVYGQYPSWSVNNEIVFSHANAGYSKEVLYTILPDGSDKKQITF
ncbi:MAG: hypothetical protein QM786_02720 [Breznakibacter sp.]